MTKFSFAKLDGGGWGVKCSADLGQAVNREGLPAAFRHLHRLAKEVTLGKMLDSWNGGRAAVYADANAKPPAAANGNGNGNGGGANGPAVAALAWSTRMLTTIWAELDGQAWSEQTAEELQERLEAIAAIFRAEGFELTRPDEVAEAVAA